MRRRSCEAENVLSSFSAPLAFAWLAQYPQPCNRAESNLFKHRLLARNSTPVILELVDIKASIIRRILYLKPTITMAVARMDGIVKTWPRILLRIEGAVIFGSTIWAYGKSGASWWLFAAGLLVPDLGEYN